MAVENWKKFCYSDEQSEELERLSQICGDMGDIDIDTVSQILVDSMKQYEVELNNERAKEIIEKLNQIPNSHCVPTKAMKKELNDLYEKITNKGEQYV